ncbi:hypothetical protein [Streptococcus suis]|uniref:hypothetical protein n=1 Tax=Streptococcus suis TaxID=1307 RepID=UPI00274246D3
MSTTRSVVVVVDFDVSDWLEEELSKLAANNAVVTSELAVAVPATVLLRSDKP